MFDQIKTWWAGEKANLEAAYARITELEAKIKAVEADAPVYIQRIIDLEQKLEGAAQDIKALIEVVQKVTEAVAKA